MARAAGKKQAPAKIEEDDDAEGWEEAVVEDGKEAEADLRLRDWRDVERYREMKELRSLVDDDYGLDEIFHVPLKPRGDLAARGGAKAAAAAKVAASAKAPVNAKVQVNAKVPANAKAAALPAKPAAKAAAGPAAKPQAKAAAPAPKKKAEAAKKLKAKAKRR
jgi:hypothetical protein